MDHTDNPYLSPTSNPETAVSGLPNNQSSIYGPYRDARGLAKVVIILLALNGVIYLALGAINVMYYNVLSAEELNLKNAESVESLMVICGIAMAIVFLVTVVMFCVWTNRMMKNTWAIRGGNHLTTPGWAVGWYFIPFVSMWKPLGAVQQMRNAVYSGPSGFNLTPWWAFWLLSNILSSVSSKLPIETVEELLTSSFFDAATSPIDAISAIFALLMVKKLTNKQHEVATAGA